MHKDEIKKFMSSGRIKLISHTIMDESSSVKSMHVYYLIDRKVYFSVTTYKDEGRESLYKFKLKGDPNWYDNLDEFIAHKKEVEGKNK